LGVSPELALLPLEENAKSAKHAKDAKKKNQFGLSSLGALGVLGGLCAFLEYKNPNELGRDAQATREGGHEMPDSFRFVATTLVFISAGCSHCHKCDALEQLEADPALAELRLIQHADPARALESAWARGEKYFLGIRGFGLFVPGVDLDAHEELVYERIGIRAIEGTGDFGTQEVLDLTKGAKPYVTRYNELLLERLLALPATRPVQR
jgi:hypothetical protein